MTTHPITSIALAALLAGAPEASAQGSGRAHAHGPASTSRPDTVRIDTARAQHRLQVGIQAPGTLHGSTRHPALGTGGASPKDTSHLHDHGRPRGSQRSANDGHERAQSSHGMLMADLGRGWTAMGMAQVLPLVTWGSPMDDDLPVHDTEAYATQPAVMLNLENPDQTLTLRATLNFEAWSQADGEYTFGGWGEGYIDKRHPHTLLHELVLSANRWDAAGGALSLSVGKGFAPYGTEDPMSRPVAKFPTNHHLSQIPERWFVAGTFLSASGLSLEAGVFGGGEPEGPYDLSNLRSFGDSYSARVAQRFGGTGVDAPWEVSASWAHVEEAHHGAKSGTELYNAAVRHSRAYGFGRLYALAEASRSDPREGAGYWALLGETRLQLGRHRPYYRIEYSTRPEYERKGAPGTDGFFRYDHGAHEQGASRWQAHSVGYETEAEAAGILVRPFGEVQFNRISGERGHFDPAVAFGTDRFWSVSAGFKIFLGDDPTRMGSYGALDAMTSAMRPGPGAGDHVNVHPAH